MFRFAEAVGPPEKHRVGWRHGPTELTTHCPVARAHETVGFQCDAEQCLTDFNDDERSEAALRLSWEDLLRRHRDATVISQFILCCGLGPQELRSSGR